MAKTPEKLIVLFRLRYLEGIHSRAVLAEKLGVKPSSVKQYCWRLRKKLIQQGVFRAASDSVDRGSTDRLSMVCPECLNTRLFTDPETEETACGSCGAVVDKVPETDNRLGFETTFALESSMATDKSLGSKPTLRETYKILAKASGLKEKLSVLKQAVGESSPQKNGNNGSSDVAAADFGLRARQVRIMSETSEHPLLADLLTMLFALSKKYETDGDHLFNNAAANILRRTFWLCREINLDYTKKSMVESVFWYTTCQFEKDTVSTMVRHELSIDPNILNLALKTDLLVKEVSGQQQVPMEAFEMLASPWSKEKMTP